MTTDGSTVIAVRSTGTTSLSRSVDHPAIMLPGALAFRWDDHGAVIAAGGGTWLRRQP